MKKILALSAAIGLAGCEYDVREQRLPPPYEPTTYDPAPMPVPSSPQPKMPVSSTGDGGTSAADGSATLPEAGDEDGGAEPR